MIIFLLVTYALCSSFAVKLAKYSSECFYEDLAHGDRLDISFEVMSSTGVYEVDFIMYNPDGSNLHKVDNHREAAFGFFAGSTGKHKMCFLNSNNPVDKLIQFNFMGPDDQVVIKSPEGATEDEKKLGQEIQNLSNEIRFMKDELAYLRRRIARHTSTAQSTNSRVFWWTATQICILFGVVYFQISYLRRFFEKRRLI